MKDEIGQMNPMLGYYSFQCRIKVIETVRPNGLIAQITPRGRISGYIIHSSIRQRTWEDAIMKENDGMHLNFPSS
jgi:hypothetical protein